MSSRATLSMMSRLRKAPAKVYMMDAIRRFQILMDVNLKNLDMDEPLPNETIMPWSSSRLLKEKYDNITEDILIRINDEYKAKYFITSSKKDYPFPIVYQNKLYKLYRLDRKS